MFILRNVSFLFLICFISLVNASVSGNDFTLAHNYTVDLSINNQVIYSNPVGINVGFGDTWDLTVAADQIVDISFVASNTGGYFSENFNVTNTGVGTAPTMIIFSGLMEGSYQFLVGGNIRGIAGSEYTVSTDVSTVPLPAAAWLMGTALIGLVSFSRRKAVLPA